MRLYTKVRAVERLFSVLDKDISRFKENTGLNCLTGCASCCFKPDIHATPLQFLPLAYDFFKEGTAEQMRENLTSNSQNTLCINLNTNHASNAAWGCSRYAHRGLICRLFGFSGTTDKHGKVVLSTCRKIKEIREYPGAIMKIEDGLPVPVMKDYYYRLRFIDPELGTMQLPINQAIAEAIRVVLSYYSYRKPRKPRKAG